MKAAYIPRFRRNNDPHHNWQTHEGFYAYQAAGMRKRNVLNSFGCFYGKSQITTRFINTAQFKYNLARSI